MRKRSGLEWTIAIISVGLVSATPFLYMDFQENSARFAREKAEMSAIVRVIWEKSGDGETYRIIEFGEMPCLQFKGRTHNEGGMDCDWRQWKGIPEKRREGGS